MENFREKLKLDNIIIAIAAIILALFSFLAAAGEAGIFPFFTPVGGDSHWQSMWRGFISGAAFAMLAFMIFGLVQNTRALRSEKALKKLYIKSNDERAIKIWTSSRAAAYQAFLLLGIVAIVVSGYYSMTVSMTVLACVFCASIIGLLFKIYYSKKF